MLFNERELSKKDFERIDIDVRSMPKEIKEKLLNGEATPLVEIRDQLDNGIIATMPVKLRLQRSEDGKAVLKAYPVSKDIVSDLKLTDKEQKQLQAGEVITKDVREGNKTRTMYLQADQETKSRMDELEHVRNITLGQNQRQAIREGKPVELEVGDTKVTVGVDLRQNSGFKAIDGDMGEWKRQQEIKWDMANPGAMGYWQTDENRWEYKQVQEKYKQPEVTTEKKEEKSKTIKEEVKQTIHFGM